MDNTSSVWTKFSSKQAEIELYKQRIAQENAKNGAKKFDTKIANYEDIFASAIGCSTRSKRLVGMECTSMRPHNGNPYRKEASIDEIMAYGLDSEESNNSGSDKDASRNAGSYDIPSVGKRRAAPSNLGLGSTSYKIQPGVGGGAAGRVRQIQDPRARQGGDQSKLLRQVVPMLLLEKKGITEDSLETGRSDAWSLYEQMLEVDEEAEEAEEEAERWEQEREDAEAVRHALRLYEGHMLTPEASSMRSARSTVVLSRPTSSNLMHLNPAKEAKASSMASILMSPIIDAYDIEDSAEALRRLTGSSFTSFHSWNNITGARARHLSFCGSAMEPERVEDRSPESLGAHTGFESLVRRVGPSIATSPQAHTPTRPMRHRRYSMMEGVAEDCHSPHRPHSPLAPGSPQLSVSVPSPHAPLSPNGSLHKRTSLAGHPSADQHPLHQHKLASPKQHLPSSARRQSATHPEMHPADELLPSIFVLPEESYLPPSACQPTSMHPFSAQRAQASSCEPCFSSTTGYGSAGNSGNIMRFNGPRPPPTEAAAPALNHRNSVHMDGPNALGHRGSKEIRAKVMSPAPHGDVKQHGTRSNTPTQLQQQQQQCEQQLIEEGVFEVFTASTPLSQGNQKLLSDIHKKVISDAFTFKPTSRALPAVEQELADELARLKQPDIMRCQSPGPLGPQSKRAYLGSENGSDKEQQHPSGEASVQVGSPMYASQDGETGIAPNETVESCPSTPPAHNEQRPGTALQLGSRHGSKQEGGETRPGTAMQAGRHGETRPGTAMQAGRHGETRPGTAMQAGGHGEMRPGTAMQLGGRGGMNVGMLRLQLPSGGSGSTYPAESPYGSRVGSIRLNGAQPKELTPKSAVASRIGARQSSLVSPTGPVPPPAAAPTAAAKQSTIISSPKSPAGTQSSISEQRGKLQASTTQKRAAQKNTLTVTTLSAPWSGPEAGAGAGAGSSLQVPLGRQHPGAGTAGKSPTGGPGGAGSSSGKGMFGRMLQTVPLHHQRT